MDHRQYERHGNHVRRANALVERHRARRALDAQLFCVQQSARGNRSKVDHVSSPPAKLICKQTRELPNRACQESRAPLLASFDVRPVQDVHPALMKQSAERRCREDKSHQSNSLDFHFMPPPVSTRASNTAKILKSRLWSCRHFSGRVSGPLGKALGFRIERVRRRVHR
jgi:hypothetical protein